MKLLRKLFFPFGFIYWIITYCRNLFYDYGIFKSYSFSVPILAVGNLSVGGTGKSPQIEYLIRLLSQYKTATLSRGYKRNTKGFVLANENATALNLGDEPYQFFSKFPKTLVAVDADRKSGIEQLLKLQDKPEVILLDDAFQHRKVMAGFYILLTTYDTLFSDDFILPFGDLRESSLGKKRANVVIVTKCPETIDSNQETEIIKKLAVKVPVFFSKIVYDNCVYAENKTIALSDLEEDIFLVAGIANPTSFFNFFETCATLSFPDHHDFNQKDISLILEKAKGKKIITTEKDYVRLKDKIDKNQLFYLPIKSEFLVNKSNFDAMILTFITQFGLKND